MSKPKPPMPKALSRFTAEGGVTGDITATVIEIKEVTLKKASKLGKVGDPFRCNVQLQDNTAEIWMEVWVPEADLPFKLNDTISINEVHNEYNEYFKAYQLKTCSRSKVKIVNPSAQRKADTTEFLGKMDEITTNTPIEKTFLTTPNPDPKTTSNTQTVIIPAQPEHRPYFPAMTIFELRDYHLREREGAIRGHIENTIQRKTAEAQRDTIIDLLGRLLEEKKK